MTSKRYWLLIGMLCLILWPVVSAAFGDWRIAQAQERLKAVGFNPGFIDGVLGPRTRDALRRYQASRGLPITGMLDDTTRQALLSRDHMHPGGEGPQTPPLEAPPGADYKRLSELAQLPDYLPGLGMLYVNPTTLPAGPFLAYDRQGNLVSSVYMIPLRDLRAGKSFPTLAVAKARMDHVDIYYNNGHALVPEPHYHIVLWYITPAQVEALQ
ncbi:MAG TPA: peptidoglycan-binding protein [Candidatus Tectomicrobia bacterium]|nr:peptidoglycan-binding protein [Candidatus Tectomicrobia bacterium]